MATSSVTDLTITSTAAAQAGQYELTFNRALSVIESRKLLMWFGYVATRGNDRFYLIASNQQQAAQRLAVIAQEMGATIAQEAGKEQHPMTEEMQIATSTSAELAQADELESAMQITSALNVLLSSLSSTSKRQYKHTFAKWSAWADRNAIGRLDMNTDNLIAFLHDEPLAQRTKQSRLSHLRKLLEAMYAAAPSNEQIATMYRMAQLLKIKATEDERQQPDRGKALKPSQIHRAFEVWADDSLLHARNRAMLAILFSYGLRRSEAAALQWADIDPETQVITVRHGKGDKRREVPYLPSDDTYWQYIEAWRNLTTGRVYVLPSLRKGDNLREDKPMTTDAIYKVVKFTGNAIGIENLAPHDARRTVITNGLNAGSSVADMQFVAGHSNPETTLGYARTKDALEVKGRVKMPY